MDERVKKIPISGKNGKGLFTIVDIDDYEKFNGLKWHLNTYGYACSQKYIEGKRYKRLFLHREIMNCPKGMVIDHKNGNKLDNRKNNLRICSNAENLRNRHDNPKHYYKNKDKWRVVIKGICYGTYKTEEEAKRIANKIISGGNIEKYHRKYRLLPKFIYKNKEKYMFRKTINGKEFYKGGFKTIKEAKEYADSFLI